MVSSVDSITSSIETTYELGCCKYNVTCCYFCRHGFKYLVQIHKFIYFTCYSHTPVRTPTWTDCRMEYKKPCNPAIDDVNTDTKSALRCRSRRMSVLPLPTRRHVQWRTISLLLHVPHWVHWAQLWNRSAAWWLWLEYVYIV